MNWHEMVKYVFHRSLFTFTQVVPQKLEVRTISYMHVHPTNIPFLCQLTYWSIMVNVLRPPRGVCEAHLHQASPILRHWSNFIRNYGNIILIMVVTSWLSQYIAIGLWCICSNNTRLRWASQTPPPSGGLNLPSPLEQSVNTMLWVILPPGSTGSEDILELQKY